MREAAEEVLWEARPRPRKLTGSDWVFYAQYVLVVVAIALILPARPLAVGPLRAWRWTLPFFALPLIALHLVHLRSVRYALVPGALLVSEGVFWTSTRRLPCPSARLVNRPAGGWDLRGEDGSRHELQGLSALQAGALRQALGQSPADEDAGVQVSPEDESPQASPSPEDVRA